jgi:hypothetical protein
MVATKSKVKIARVQTGVRVEKRILKVLKALAAHKELSLSDLLEGILLHSFDNKPPFSRETLETIATLRDVYKLDLTSDDSHNLQE